jgi:hypothetical protein
MAEHAGAHDVTHPCCLFRFTGCVSCHVIVKAVRRRHMDELLEVRQCVLWSVLRHELVSCTHIAAGHC